MYSLNGDQEFFGTAPIMSLRETDAAVDGKIWDLKAEGGVLTLSLVNDARNSNTSVMQVTRSVANVTSTVFPNGNFGIGGTPTAKLQVFAGNTVGNGILIEGTSSPKLRVSETSTSVFFDFQVDTVGGYIGTTSNHTLYVRTNNIYRLLVDTNGNFGFSTTDIESWGTNYRAFQLGTHNSIMYGTSATDIYYLNNLYHNGTDWKYRTTGEASYVQQIIGRISVFTAPSGTIDTTPTLTEVLTLTNVGNLGIGISPVSSHTYSPSTKILHISSSTGGSLLLERTAATARKWSLSNSTSGDFILADETSAVLRLSISTTGNTNLYVDSVANNGLTVNGASSPRLRVADTGSSVFLDCQVDGVAGYIGTSSNSPLILRVNSAEYARLTTAGYFGIGSGATTARPLHVEATSAATATTTRVARFTSTSTGTPANGIGVGVEFEVETAAGVNKIGAAIEAIATDVTSTSEDFKLRLHTMVAGTDTAVAEISERGLLCGTPLSSDAWKADVNRLVLGGRIALYDETVNEHAGLAYNAYQNSAGDWKYKNTGDIAVVHDGRDIGYTVYAAASGTAGNTITFSLEATLGPGGVVIGAPTGGAKGTGTINATAVYDDNVLLTCYVIDQYLDGTMSTVKWDSKVPVRLTKGIGGDTLSIPRIHEPFRKFAARIGTPYDPLDLDKFWQHIVDKRHLTAYPNEDKYDPINGKQDIGSWQQQTIELLEIYAIHIKKLNDRIKALELAP